MPHFTSTPPLPLRSKKTMLRLAILTDEVSQDLDAVLRFASDFQLGGIELRSLFGSAFKDLTSAQIHTIAERTRAAGLIVAGCASPVFKCELHSAADIATHREHFRRAIETAHTLGCDLVRVFTFLRNEHATTVNEVARAAAHFPALLEIAEGSGVRIGVENEASCLIATGAEMHDFLAHLPVHPQLGVVWDPCNVLYLAGRSDPVRDDFPLIAERVLHFHVKDAARHGTRPAEHCVELGTGSLDFPAQLRALLAHGYRGWVSLETHWRSVPLDDDSQHLPAGHAFSAHAEPASRVCMEHLQRWVRDAESGR